MKHPVSGEIKELGQEAFLSMFAPEVRTAIGTLFTKFPDAIAIAAFQNLQLDSSQRGHLTAMVVRPNGTINLDKLQTAEARLGCAPSNFQYPVAIWLRDK